MIINFVGHSYLTGEATLREMRLSEGSHARLHCYADSYLQDHPGGTVVWYRNDHRVHNSGRYFIFYSSLRCSVNFHLGLKPY